MTEIYTENGKGGLMMEKVENHLLDSKLILLKAVNSGVSRHDEMTEVK